MEKPPARDLKERTHPFARRIIRLCTALPKNAVAQVLGKQVLRSGTSVGANYREAFRGRSKPEFIANMGDCLRELYQSEYWLELLVDESIVSREKMNPLLDETRQLIAVFVTIIKSSRRSLNS